MTTRDISTYFEFEDTFDFFLSGDDTSYVKQLAIRIFTPTIHITEASCNTLLGSNVKADYGLIGRKTPTGATSSNYIKATDAYSLMAASKDGRARIRTTESCISKGICLSCLSSSYPHITAPVINKQVQLYGKMMVGTTRVLATVDGDSHNFYSSVTPERVDVFDAVNGYYLSSDTFYWTFNEDTLTGSVYLPAGEFYVITSLSTTKPFYNYLCRSYSGSLFGLKELPTCSMPLSVEKIRAQITESDIIMAKYELSKMESLVPDIQLEYVDQIVDPLEKVLYIIFLYAMYSDALKLIGTTELNME